MPALEIPPVGAGESSRPDTAHRSALPETVVDVGQFGLPATRICRRLPDGNAPRGRWNLVAGAEKDWCGQHEEAKEEVREEVHDKRALGSCHGSGNAGLSRRNSGSLKHPAKDVKAEVNDRLR